MTALGKAHIKLIFIVFLCCAYTPVLWADAYLDEVEAEADTKTPTAKLPQRAQQKQMEKELQGKFPASFKIYAKLNERNQAQVVAAYVETHNLNQTSKKIFDLYMAQSK